jgi:hypothetical protein
VKKELLFAFMALFLMSITAITGVYALETDTKLKLLINQQVDITGDGKKDDILLHGVLYPKNDIVYKEFFLTIQFSNGKTFHKKLNYGLDPIMSLIDLNHDGVKDVFLRIPTGQSGGVSKHYLYSNKDNHFTNIPIPELEVLGAFTNDYKAKISIPATKETFVFDLIFRKDMYESLGMYQNGKLNEPTELLILPYGNLKPLTTKNATYGLKGLQRISGTSKSDIIAFVETTWYYRDGDWKLVNTAVRKVAE